MALVSDSYSSIKDPQAFVDAGYVGCMRYISNYPPKDVTRAELERCWSVGLLMGFNWETTGKDWRLGYGGGHTAAVRAEAQMNDLGIPGDVPIYYSPVDEGYRPEDQGTILDYMHGVYDVNPARPLGLYGGLPLIRDALGYGMVQFGWIASAYSWSFELADHSHAGRIGPPPDPSPAHLLQQYNQPTIGGTQIDVNTALQDYWGGYNPNITPPTKDWFDMASLEELDALLDKKFQAAAFGQLALALNLDNPRAVKTVGNPAWYVIVTDGKGSYVKQHISAQELPLLIATSNISQLPVVELDPNSAEGKALLAMPTVE